MPDIRPLQPDDRVALQAILRSHAWLRADEVAVAMELIDATLAGTDDYRVRVAVADAAAGPNLVTGYVCYGPTPMTHSTYDLYWIVTHAAATGRGVAAALLRTMEDELRQIGAGAVRIETSLADDYAAARRLYERFAYPRVASLRDFYRPGDHLAIYYKLL